MQGQATSRITNEMQQCIQECLNCHSVCLQIVTYCLQQGGRHAGGARHDTARLLGNLQDERQLYASRL
ncbi:MAG TPA: hypothetical protein VI260_04490 [Blastocatellia bacterium]|jgi:hypothetical protein